MKVAFVHTQSRFFADTQTFGVHLMPVWAYTLAAHLAAFGDVELALVDDRFDDVDTVAPADVFLFTGINQDYDAIVATHARLAGAHPSAVFAIGGPICWSFATAGKLDALAMFDHVFIGDGEETVVRFIADVRAGRPVPKVVETRERFPLDRALPMHRGLLARTLDRYYGAVLEVGRGCPFLCEFCDIRVLPDNNRAHVKDPALIVDELDALHDLGARQVLFACDNFIGDHRWAEDVADAILAWSDRTGKRLSLYTWLTINVARHPRLLAKLRRAGFDLFFIGIESFAPSALLETAKVQNEACALTDAIRTIQSYGFVVVAGLIFGFDTDPEDVVPLTLRGILESGLISGDPSLLTALPGTPLHRRMQLAGRLRDGKIALGGFKYQTNIKYLRPAERMRADFRAFVDAFIRGRYQYARYARFVGLMDDPRYVAPRTAGYADLGRLLRLTLRNRRAITLFARRLARLFGSPERALWIARAFVLTLRRTRRDRPLWFYFKFWLFNWSNAVVKYAGLTDADFDIASVPPDFAVSRILPEPYEAARDADVPETKHRAQRRATVTALRRFVAAHAEPRRDVGT